MGGRGSGRKPLSAEVHLKRGTFRHDRHGVSGLSEGDGPQAKWLVGLDRHARIQGVFYLQYYQPLDRLAFRRLLRAHGDLERFLCVRCPGPWQADLAAARNAQGRRLRARIAELKPLVGWRLR